VKFGCAMDQQALGRFRKTLKEHRDAVHFRLVLAREQGRVQNQSEVTDEGDRGSAQTDKEMSAVQQTQAQDLLANINAALDRIDAGTFGECLNCSQEVSVRRLEAIPWARYCITCQELIDGTE
jgi:DnaK suppressor protein